MPGAEKAPQTLYDKVLQAHVVDEKLDGTLLLYIGTFTSHGPQRQLALVSGGGDGNNNDERLTFAHQTATSYMKSHPRRPLRA